MTTATRARTLAGDDAVAVLVDRVDAHVLADLRAGSDGGRQQRLLREVGEDEASVGLEEAAPARLDPDREAALDLGGVQHLERRPARRERVAVGPPVAEVERPGLLQQRPAALGLELAPERVGLLREAHVALLGIREPDDPRAAVARAALVTDLELLAEHHVPPGQRERACRCEPHHAGADDHDLCVGGRAHVLEPSSARDLLAGGEQVEQLRR